MGAGCDVETFIPVEIAVLTVSDSRSEETDTSGRLLAERLQADGHHLVGKVIVPDNLYKIRAQVSHWVADPAVQAIIITGGTGLTARDHTPEAVRPLFDKEIDGFGELFRSLSYPEIKAATVQSRVLAGIANATFIFCVPGSTNACRLAWDGLLKEQLDSRTGPCNFVQLFPRLKRDCACAAHEHPRRTRRRDPRRRPRAAHGRCGRQGVGDAARPAAHHPRDRANSTASRPAFRFRQPQSRSLLRTGSDDGRRSVARSARPTRGHRQCAGGDHLALLADRPMRYAVFTCGYCRATGDGIDRQRRRCRSRAQRRTRAASLRLGATHAGSGLGCARRSGRRQGDAVVGGAAHGAGGVCRRPRLHQYQHARRCGRHRIASAGSLSNIARAMYPHAGRVSRPHWPVRLSARRWVYAATKPSQRSYMTSAICCSAATRCGNRASIAGADCTLADGCSSSPPSSTHSCTISLVISVWHCSASVLPTAKACCSHHMLRSSGVAPAGSEKVSPCQ